MRIVFLGGFLRGHRLLSRLIERKEQLVGAFVFEEYPHERTRFADDMETLCVQHAVPVAKTRKLTKDQIAQIADEFRPDVVFCLGWRTMLPPEMLELAPRGVVAAHDSLLPRLRGFAPTNWGLLLGHDQLGVTLIQLSDGVDEGEVYFQAALQPTPEDRLPTLIDRIAELSVGLFDRYLNAVRDDSLEPQVQEHARATYCCARTPEDGEIDFSAPTEEIVRMVRALAPPAPGAFTYYDRRILKVLAAGAVQSPQRYEGRIPGRVVARDASTGTIDVLSGDGTIRIEQVELDGLQPQPPAAIIKSVRAYLGVRPAVEIADLHRTIGTLEQRLEQLGRRMEHMEQKQ